MAGKENGKVRKSGHQEIRKPDHLVSWYPNILVP